MMLGAGLLIGAGIGLLFLAAVELGGVYLVNRRIQQASGNQLAAPDQNSPAPEFTLQNVTGETIRLADYRGKAVLINFWATWCGPCKVEMPLIQKYFQKFSSNLAVLAVNNDEPLNDVKSYVDEMGLTFTVLLDPGEKVENIYRVDAFPTSIFVSSDGVIKYRHIGVMNEDQLVQYLNQLGVGK
jgi:cytochrome c biogenesis protein CcmG/thiol:disulfide interchange protein DsbE